eukprot:12791745-Prorocentrum_lima.AAC.1
MTSSLVGSEMCIRDRIGSVRGALLRCPASRHVPRPLPIRQVQACKGPLAVSYTHLTLPTICSV